MSQYGSQLAWSHQFYEGEKLTSISCLSCVVSATYWSNRCRLPTLMVIFLVLYLCVHCRVSLPGECFDSVPGFSSWTRRLWPIPQSSGYSTNRSYTSRKPLSELLRKGRLHILPLISASSHSFVSNVASQL